MKPPQRSFTKIPNSFLDEYLWALSKGAVKVYLYLARRIFGFQKSSDRISLSQICHGIRTRDGRTLDRGTGLKRDTAIVGLRELEALGLIVRHKGSGTRPDTYEIEYPPISPASGLLKGGKDHRQRSSGRTADWSRGGTHKKKWEQKGKTGRSYASDGKSGNH